MYIYIYYRYIAVCCHLCTLSFHGHDQSTKMTLRLSRIFCDSRQKEISSHSHISDAVVGLRRVGASCGLLGEPVNLRLQLFTSDFRRRLWGQEKYGGRGDATSKANSTSAGDSATRSWDRVATRFFGFGFLVPLIWSLRLPLYMVITISKFCLPLELPYLQNQSKLDSKCWYWQESIQFRRFAVETFVNQSCPHKAFLGICGHFDLLL